MDALFLPLADLVGASADQVKLITCLLISYPLGSLFIRVPSNRPTLRHLFNLGVALAFFLPILNLYNAFFQLLGSTMLTYFIAKYNHSRNMPWIVFAITFGHLTVNHIIRAIYNLSYETLEITGPQMVLVMKLTTFAWNVWDGRRPASELDKWQTAKRVVKFPSLLEFLGYAFYFPGVLVGPYLDYAAYDELVRERIFQGAESKNGRKIPSGRKRVAYGRMLMGLVYLGIFVFFGGQYNFSATLEPWFAAKSLLQRIGLLQVFGFLERCKYYAIWTLTEGASIVTGLGFTGFNSEGKSVWNEAANVDVLRIEFPENFKQIFDSWNMKTNVWLRECIYKRVTPKGKKPGFRSSMLTFMVSAFWHGVHIGYYLAFLFAGFVTTAARLVRNNVRPLLLPPPGQGPSLLKRVYDISGTVVSLLVLNYIALPFMVLTFEGSIQAWARLAFYGHIMVFGCLTFLYAGGIRFFRNLQKAKGITLPVKQVSRPATPSSEKNFILPPPVDHIIPPPEK